MPKKSPPKRRHAMTIGFNKKTGKAVKLLVPYSNATERAEATIALEHAKRGEPGACTICAISESIMDGSSTIDHPVPFAETCARFVYVADRINRQGLPTHVVKYEHGQADWIDKFDVPGGKARLIREWVADRIVELRVPSRRRGSQAGLPDRKSGGTGGRSTARFWTGDQYRGAMRRARNAGLTSLRG